MRRILWSDIRRMCCRPLGRIPAPSCYSRFGTPYLLPSTGGYPPSPLSIGISGLGGNSRQIFEFKGLIAKIFENQRLRGDASVRSGLWRLRSRSRLSNSWRKTDVSRGLRARQRLVLEWTTKLVIVI